MKSPEYNQQSFTEFQAVSTSEKAEQESELPQEISVLQETLEKEVPEALEKAVAKIEESIDQLPEDLPDEKKLQILERLKQRVFNFSKRVTQFTMVLLLGLTLNYQRTEHHIDFQQAEEQETTWSHPDKNTDQLLRYISGVDSLSEEERMKTIKPKVEGWVTWQNQEVPSNYDSLTLEQLADWLVSQFPETYPSHEAVLRDYEVLIPSKYDYDEAIYQKMGEILEQTGAPKVRLTNKSGLLGAPLNHGYYNPLTNTVNLVASPSWVVIRKGCYPSCHMLSNFAGNQLKVR